MAIRESAACTHARSDWGLRGPEQGSLVHFSRLHKKKTVSSQAPLGQGEAEDQLESRSLARNPVLFSPYCIILQDLRNFQPGRPGFLS